MAYKYSNAGLDGEDGKRIDKLCDEKLNENLQRVFRYPLQIERSGGEEEVVVPAVPFHIVRVGMPKIYHRDETDKFEQLLLEVPSNLHLILDLEGVRFVGSEVFSPLIKLLKAMREKARIFLVHVEKPVLEKFQITRLDRVLSIRSNTQQAYEEIQRLVA